MAASAAIDVHLIVAHFEVMLLLIVYFHWRCFFDYLMRPKSQGRLFLLVWNELVVIIFEILVFIKLFRVFLATAEASYLFGLQLVKSNRWLFSASKIAHMVNHRWTLIVILRIVDVT